MKEVSKRSLVSIVIPTYNAVQFIVETMECCLNQTYKNIEIIIQDDCSNDGTWELLQNKYHDVNEVKLYRNEKNLGIGNNWNEAYNKVKGEYVIIFNADDIFDRDFISFSLRYMEEYNVDFVINSYHKSDDSDAAIAEIKRLSKPHAGITTDLINTGNDPGIRISLIYTLARKSSLEKLKHNDMLFYPTQICDMLLWTEAFRQKMTAYYTGEVKGVYRMHDSNNSKIPMGEYESTMLYMMPIYHKEFRMKHPQTLFSKPRTLSQYLYLCLKYKKRINRKVVLNIIKYS